MDVDGVGRGGRSRHLLAAVLVFCGWLLSMPAFAQSACTAVWGIRSPTTTTGGLSYLNTETGQWSPILLGLPGNPNALAGSPTSGLLYFLDRNTQNLYSINLNSYPLAYSQVGVAAIPAPPAPALAGNLVAGTMDGAGNYFVYATQGAYNDFVAVAQISTATAATVTSWTQVLTVAGAVPNILGYGDMFVDRFGTTWIATNTNPPTFHQINLNPGPGFGRTNVPPITITGAPAHEAFSVSADPITGAVYMGGATNIVAGGPYNSVTFRVTLPAGNAVLLPQADNTYFLSDMGNCAQAPAPPSVTKVFAPDSRAAAPGTSTLTITLANPNLAPVYLTSDFLDVLPAGLVIHPLPSLAGSCVMAGNTVTAAADTDTVTMVAGSRVPAGGCSLSVQVLASAPGAYVNTVPAGSLRTTAGTNTAAALATFQVGVTDFSMTKTQRAGTTGPAQAGPLSVPSGGTLQYVLELVNGAGSTGPGSATFSDTLPSAITPVLAVSAVLTGGGTCVTATSVVAGRTVVSGTLTAVPAGQTCTVTITARASVTTVLTAFTNTATLTALPAAAGSYDSSAANNSASVFTTVVPQTLLVATKSNGTAQVSSGATTTYVITVSNQGPAAADGTRVSDPVATGLGCTAVACSGAGGATCPPAPVSLAQMQSPAGLLISGFPAGSTATFSLTCTVTASGL